MTSANVKLFIGLDLSGTSKKKTAYAVLDCEKKLKFYGFLKTDEEIVKYIAEVRPEVIAIDAPLTLPKRGKMRECDRAVRSLGIRIFPPLMKGMEKLTLRGIALSKRLKNMGFRVIEVFPGGAQDILGIARKSKGVEKLYQGLSRLGLNIGEIPLDPDLLDAVTAAYTALMYFNRKYIAVVSDDCEIIFPLPSSRDA